MCENYRTIMSIKKKKTQTCTVHLKAGLQGVAEQSAINRKAKRGPPMHAAHANQNRLGKAILPSGFSFFFPSKNC